jgi:hypothetical protein
MIDGLYHASLLQPIRFHLKAITPDIAQKFNVLANNKVFLYFDAIFIRAADFHY